MEGSSKAASLYPSSKSRIYLAEYPYRQDIEHRLFLSTLSDFEITVLKEIVSNSLKIPILTLLAETGSTLDRLLDALEKLSQTRLFTSSHDTLYIDKEIRKYFEIQVNKFSRHFRPDLEFLKGRLKSVPLDLQPHWYGLPKNSDKIFEGIIEKYFYTPKVYERYLEELIFEDPVLNRIKDELLTKMRMSAHEVCKAYSLSHEQFQEACLKLEFHLVGVLSYEKISGGWQEVVTLYQEWIDYKSAQHAGLHPPHESIKIHEKKSTYSQLLTELQNELSRYKSRKSAKCTKIISKIFKDLQIDHPVQDFIIMPIHEKMALIYRRCLHDLYEASSWQYETFERSVHELEKHLRHSQGTWIEKEPFITYCTARIGNTDPIEMRCNGKSWGYSLPKLGPKENQFIDDIIMGPLFNAGIIRMGNDDNGRCYFKVTNEGMLLLQ